MRIPAKQVDGRPRKNAAALAYAAALTLDLASAQAFAVTLTGRAIVTFTNLAEGQSGDLYVTQDATGGHELTFNLDTGGQIIASGSLAPTLTADAVTRYRYDVALIGGALGVALSAETYSSHPTLAGILGANLVDYWISEDAQLEGGAVQAVTGRIGGHTLTAPDAAHRMLWTASNADLNGHPSMGATVAGAENLENTALPNIIAAGSTPFAFVVVSFTDFVSGTDQTQCVVGSATWIMEARKSYHNLFRGVCYDSGYGQAVVNGPGITANQTPHIIGVASVNPGVHVWHDGAMSTAYFNAEPQACDNVTRVRLGGSAGEIALLGVCADRPTDAQLAQLYAYVQTEYGVT